MTTPLIGLWSLTEFVVQSKSAQLLKRPFGLKPHGFLSYHSSGHMQALLCHEQQSPFPKNLEHAHTASTEAKAQAFNESLSYAGEWTLTDRQVAHHVHFSTNPQIMGQMLIRRINRLSKEQLVLSYDVPSRSGPIEYILKWQKV